MKHDWGANYHHSGNHVKIYKWINMLCDLNLHKVIRPNIFVSNGIFEKKKGKWRRIIPLVEEESKW